MEHAQPGDTIKITKIGDFLNKEFVVIECPNDGVDRSNRVWVRNKTTECTVEDKNYKIVKQARRHQSIAPNNVDASLDRQRNENLRSVFG